MQFSLFYLGARVIHRVKEFIEHWYQGGFYIVHSRARAVLRLLDETFAVGVTLRHFGQPLFGDYTILGRILGYFFRTIRVAMGILLYSVIISLAAILYALWAAVPPYLVARMFL